MADTTIRVGLYAMRRSPQATSLGSAKTLRTFERSYMFPDFLAHIWDFIWMFFTIFIFFAWLMALFSIIGDLFRDKDMSGWAKAIWLIFLISIPFLTALIYLIVRGRGMSERSHAQARANRAAADDYIRSVSGSSPADQIAQAKQLLDSGAINAAEFERIKAKALS